MSRIAYSTISVNTPPHTRPPLPSFFLAPRCHPHNLPPRLPCIEPLRSHLLPRPPPLPRLATPPNLPLLPHPHDPPPNPPRPHRPPPRDRKYVFNRHQVRLVHPPRRRRNITVPRLPQLPDRFARLGVLRLLVRLQPRPPDHPHPCPRQLVLLQQLPDPLL